MPGHPLTLTKVPSTPNSVRSRPVGANRAAPVTPFLPAWAYPARAPSGRARMERSLKPVSCASVMQTGTHGRPACAMHVDRRPPTFRPQARKILAGSVIQDSLDHRRVFDTRDDLNRSSALRAGFDINLENPLKAPRPSHRRALLGRCGILRRLRPLRLAASPSAGRRDPGPVLGFQCVADLTACGQEQALF